ncbi:MAG: response regulator [Bacteroidota bacterium]
MSKKENDFLKKLLATFRIEAEDHVKTISSGLMELESETHPEERIKIIETIFREAHSLKGAARAVNNSEIETLCQSLENIFSKLKNRKLNISPGLLDLFHLAVNYLDNLLSAKENQLDELKRKVGELTKEIDNKIISAESDLSQLSEPIKKEQTLMQEKHLSAQTIRIPVNQLDSVLLQSEEFLGTKLSSAQKLSELHEINTAIRLWEKNWAKAKSYFYQQNNNKTKDPKASKEKKQTDDFLEWNEDFIKMIGNKLTALEAFSAKEHRALSSMVDNLIADMKKTLMMPFSTLLEIFPKIVRDLSRDQGKDVDLIIKGESIEIDRRILEEIKDPLIHIVRNCVDHGIEIPTERLTKNKPVRGSIKIEIIQKHGDKIEIIIIDDGAGIDFDKTKNSAIKLGIIEQDSFDKLSKQEILGLVFQSGVTTSTIITNLSGRGLGLAIVREKIEKIGGTVSVDSNTNTGTTFLLELPITLATIRGIIVRCAERLFVIATVYIEKVMRINRDDIKTVENRETILFYDQTISLVRLNEIMEIQTPNTLPGENKYVSVLIVNSAEKRIAFLVDEILGEQEVLVKRLGTQLERVRNIGGVSILGTGEVVPILNVTDLMKSAVKAHGAKIQPAAKEMDKKSEVKKSILVVEDSITARTLLKNILETSGYNVKTAVDGVDGYTQLRSGKFDIVVSDVDMPRMSGFDLTQKIRADKKFSDLPVILVTALETREDREHGIDVGANAYMVKSSFDQSNLLEVIKQLI